MRFLNVLASAREIWQAMLFSFSVLLGIVLTVLVGLLVSPYIVPMLFYWRTLAATRLSRMRDNPNPLS
ncbi:MAG: hypothetical protein V1656_03010 [Candidatus Jorgensenbacteria bacterium]